MTLISFAIKRSENVRDLFRFKTPLAWPGVFLLLGIHFAMLFALLTRPWVFLSWKAWLWVIFTVNVGNLGALAGGHRLWCHRSYKAKLPLRIFLMACYLVSGQYSMLKFCRDHRLHHKCADTDGDPHNINRGIFFGHFGWLMMKKHPDVKKYGSSIDLSDVMADPVVAFQQKYYFLLLALIFPLSGVLPVLLWNEDIQTAFFGCFILRYVLQTNTILLINSISHTIGDRPFNQKINPTDTIFVSILTLGEGFHNFHHTFPFDYRTAHKSSRPNFSAFFIDVCAKLGLAYDLKEVSDKMLDKYLAKNQNKKMLELKNTIE